MPNLTNITGGIIILLSYVLFIRVSLTKPDCTAICYIIGFLALVLGLSMAFRGTHSEKSPFSDN